MNRFFKTYKKFFIPVMIVVGLNLVLAGAVWAQAKTSDQRSKGHRLFRLSGMKAKQEALSQKVLVPAVFPDLMAAANPDNLNRLGMPPGEIEVIGSLFREALKGEEFYKTKLKHLLKSYDRQHIKGVLRWFQSPLSKKIIKMEVEKGYKTSSEDFSNFIGEVMQDPPSKKRLSLVDRLENARNTVDYHIQAQVDLLWAVEPLGKSFPGKSVDDMVQMTKIESRDSIRTKNLLFSMYQYQKLSDSELESLVRFYETDAGQWFARADLLGNLAGLKQVNQKIISRLGSLMVVLKSGEEDSAKIKEIFPPGLRFRFTKKRDPFIPLVSASVGLEEAGGEEDPLKASSTERFGVELESLEAIPFELLRVVEDTDPMLHADLEFYGTLFKDKGELGKLDQEEYSNEVENYRNLIEKANKLAEEMITTPLQSPYDSLKLVGIIWDGKEAVALIEDSASQGFSVREGTLLGPRFGVVDSIDDEKVVIIERARDFLGDMVSETKILYLSQTDQ